MSLAVPVPAQPRKNAFRSMFSSESPTTGARGFVSSTRAGGWTLSCSARRASRLTSPSASSSRCCICTRRDEVPVRLGPGALLNHAADPDVCKEVSPADRAHRAARSRRPCFNHPSAIARTTRDEVAAHPRRDTGAERARDDPHRCGHAAIELSEAWSRERGSPIRCWCGSPARMAVWTWSGSPDRIAIA